MTTSRPHLTDCQNIYTQREHPKTIKNKVYTSFGSLKGSKETSAPKYSFGRSTRDQQPKRYLSKEIAKTDNFGASTPKGPDFAGDDQYAYRKSPEWKMTTTPRMKLDTQAQYEYFHMPNDLELIESNKKVKPRPKKATFGYSPRFETERSRSPGPQYYPGMKGQSIKQPGYSIAMRRNVKGQDPIFVVNGTDQEVGPGTYKPQTNLYTSRSPDKPKWTFPHSQRSPYKSSTSLHQTYDTTSSMGRQIVSKKETRPKFTINGSRRSNSPGILKTEMQFQQMKVYIPHPTFQGRF